LTIVRPDALAPLHAAVDREARRLHVLHAERLQCQRGCSSCCVDGLTVGCCSRDGLAALASTSRVFERSLELVS
jgi:hypothetical protein